VNIGFGSSNLPAGVFISQEMPVAGTIFCTIAGVFVLLMDALTIVSTQIPNGIARAIKIIASPVLTVDIEEVSCGDCSSNILVSLVQTR
jgi:hypothetical protein